MRRLIAFDCDGDRLLGTLDAAAGKTGVLIVSGGNEVRIGTHRGMTRLAQALATAGVPAFRFDRRGIGDSGGDNHGWQSSAPDLAAAVATFRREQPQLTRLVGLGNCDAATALAMFGGEAGIDALVLTNPWLGDDDPLPPPAAVRAHYTRRIIDPAAWRRLLGGGVSPRKLLRGLTRAASARTELPLAERVAAAAATLPATIVLAEGDRTAQHFAAALPGMAVTRIASSSHSFADAGEALLAAVLAAARQTGFRGGAGARRRCAPPR